MNDYETALDVLNKRAEWYGSCRRSAPNISGLHSRNVVVSAIKLIDQGGSTQ